MFSTVKQNSYQTVIIHSTTCKALSASLIAIKNIKCHKTQNATSKLNMLITNEGEILTLKLFLFPFPFKGTKMEETTHNLHLFTKKTTFTFKSDGYLLPGRMLPSRFLFGPPPRGGGGTSTTSGDDCFISSSLQRQETIS